MFKILQLMNNIDERTGILNTLPWRRKVIISPWVYHLISRGLKGMEFLQQTHIF